MRVEARDELSSPLAELRALSEIEEIEALSNRPWINQSELYAVLCVDVEDEAALERYRNHPSHEPSLSRLRNLRRRSSSPTTNGKERSAQPDELVQKRPERPI
jgi:hypothetical protein